MCSLQNKKHYLFIEEIRTAKETWPVGLPGDKKSCLGFSNQAGSQLCGSSEGGDGEAKDEMKKGPSVEQQEGGNPAANADGLNSVWCDDR